MALNFGQLSESSPPEGRTEVSFPTAKRTDTLQINYAGQSQPPIMHTPRFEFMPQRSGESNNLLQVEPLTLGVPDQIKTPAFMKTTDFSFIDLREPGFIDHTPEL